MENKRKKQRKQIRLDSKFLFNLPKTWNQLKQQLSSHFDGLTTLEWLFAIDNYVRIFLMRVNIKLFTGKSYVKVFAFHRLICINLNSTNQTNANRGVVATNPKSGNWWFLTHVCALVTTFEKVPPQKRQYHFHARLYRRRRTLETESTKIEKSVPNSHKIKHSHKQRTVLEQQNKRKIIFEKKNQRWTHKKRYSPHLL